MTIDPNDPKLREIHTDGPLKGQQKDYLVLSEEERAKGFVRPVRRTYIHIGCRPKHPTRLLTAEEHERYDRFGYVCYEEYPPSEDSAVTGRYWTQKQLDSGCNGATTMGMAIAETYARNPSFYGSTFCVHCGQHFPVGAQGEFEWEDGEKVGT